MDRSCPNSFCEYKYSRKKKPFKCPDCDAYIGKDLHDNPKQKHVYVHVFSGGKFVPTPAKPKQPISQAVKVIKFGVNYFSVHTNQIYRTVCHVPPG